MTKKTDGKYTAAKDAPGIEENSAVAQVSEAILSGSINARSVLTEEGIALYGRQVTVANRLDTAPLDALLAEIGDVPDELDGIELANAKREATFKLSAAINAMKVLRKLSA